MKNIDTLDVNNEHVIQHLNDIYVGPECENFLATQSLEFSKEIKLKCLEFYKTAVREMMKRLPYNNSFFKQLVFLDPKIALFDEARTEIKDLTAVATRLGFIDITKLAYEWRILPTVFNDQEKKELASLEINEMWKKILEFKDFTQEKLFPNLELLIESVLSLPHSNAEAERIFSIISDIKNKKRNRMSIQTMSAICVGRSSFQAEGINCINFEIEPRHLELYNPQNLYAGQSASTSSDGI